MHIARSVAVLFLSGISLLLAQQESISLPRSLSIDSITVAGSGTRQALADVIVEFVEEPLFIARIKTSGNLRTVSPDFYNRRFAQFSADVTAINSGIGAAATFGTTVKGQYYKSFFGVSLSVPQQMLPLLQNLPYVKSVHIDHEVTASLERSIPQIGVDQVWQVFGTQGAGIRVGIIDSGIDYMHPALGGGFGPGFKVAGGYDFVNNDNDPMDDAGHGTHVAGIVSANSETLKGVAPQATLYAYKVLDAEGRGSESVIIDAIERAVDPDNNGDPSDRLDIVNLSLGSNEGSPTDPSAIAVNNAVRLGSVFVVAAGNSGYRTPTSGKENNYFYNGSATIGSPGTAELAITVGAADTLDKLAGFSSKGPNRVTFGIKPEVLAPGTKVNSTFLNSGVTRLNGTSMASPMIAGVAALLKSLYPDWSPAQIKSAIVNTAKNIAISSYHQGGGRVNAFRAASVKTHSIPSVLNFGMDDPSVSIWSKPDTVIVHNIHSTAQSYTSSVNSTSAGITLQVQPSSFSIPANDSALVVVTLSIQNAQVPVEDDNILLFTGRVQFSGSVDTIALPWGCARANRIVITTSEPNAYFLGYTNAGMFTSYDNSINWTSPTRAEVYAPQKGTYRFFSVFRRPAGKSGIVIKEGISVLNNDAVIHFNAGDAVHPLVFAGVDHDGKPIRSYRAPQRSIVTGMPSFGDWMTTFPGGSDTVMISPVSVGFTFKPVEFQMDLVGTKSFHIVQYPKFSGVSGAKTFTNESSNFISQQFIMHVPPGTPQALVVGNFYDYRNHSGMGAISQYGLELDTVSVSGDSFSFTGYIGRSSLLLEDAAFSFLTLYSDIPGLKIDYESRIFMTINDSIIPTAREHVTPAILRSPSGGTVTLGGSPVHLLMLWYNNTFGANSLHFQTIFRGALREDRYGDLNNGTYSIYNKNGEKIFTNPLNDFPRDPRELTADWYTMVVETENHWVRNAKGKLTYTSSFDLSKGPGTNPPSITSFALVNEQGVQKEGFVKDEKGYLLFSSAIYNLMTNVLPIYDSTKVWWRIHGTTQWHPLPVEKIAEYIDNEGLIMRADLSATTATDSVAIDLRVFAKESNGFTLDQILEPAYAVGNWNPVITNVVDNENPVQIPSEFSLSQNFPNPFNPVTTILYSVPRTTEVSLVVYDLLGREIAMPVTGVHQPGNYSVRFDGTGLSSGVYLYRMTAGEYIQTKKFVLLK
jgi:hypothetical protein